MSTKKRPLTASDLTEISILSDPRLTPDGKSYTFIRTSINEDQEYVSHILMQSLENNDIKHWTTGNDKNSQPKISPNGQQIVFQSDRSGLPQLWIMDMHGGEAKQLTRFKHGATNPHWSKDSSTILFTASLEKDADVTSQKERTEEEKKKEQEEKKEKSVVINRLKYKSDAAGFLEDTYSQIVSYDIKNDTFTQLTKDECDHAYEDISPDGRYVLLGANTSDDADYELTNDLYLLDISTKEMTCLTNGDGGFGDAAFSPDGSKIVTFGHHFEYAGATLNDLFIIDIKTKEKVCLSDNWDIQLGDAMIGDMRLGQSTTGPVWSKDGKHIYFIATDFGATGLYGVNLEGTLETLYKDNNHVFGFSYNEVSGNFILGVSTPTNPGNYYELDASGKLTRLTNENAAFLEEVQIQEPETITVTADDGWEVQGWIMQPYGFEEGKKYPFVLEVHGGPHAMYGQTFFHEMQLLAAKGYVVLYTNPRGSHGYGQKFVDACRADYGGKDYTDLMSAVDYALKNYSYIDEDRLGVTGGSYGGFMTNWIVGHTNRFKAAVTQRCISNWLSFYGVSDIGYFFTKWELGKNLLEDPKKLWEFSPLKYAENVETPLLIVHGELDFRCPIEQGEQMYVALKHLKKETEFVRFPGSNHELSRSGKPKMRIERLNHICRWFEKYL
ncbi:MAG TPA: S9 family peptidase [Bacillota bacterium]|nr:S9 family peptidase [Bacillota bacterium]